jgi:hypothetical protein
LSTPQNGLRGLVNDGGGGLHGNAFPRLSTVSLLSTHQNGGLPAGRVEDHADGDGDLPPGADFARRLAAEIGLPDRGLVDEDGDRELVSDTLIASAPTV